MRKHQAAVVACGGYEQEKVDAAVRRALDLLGGLGSVVQSGMRVVIKANLLKRNKPEDCVTTHPAIVCAVAKQVRELGATAVIGDSPGGPFNAGMLRSIYRDSGMQWAAEHSGATLNFDTATQTVHFPEGVSVKQFEICRYLCQADAVINCAKLKTHGLTTYTGAVKNLYGIVPGTVKVEYHFRMPELDRFCNMLVDLCAYLQPAFSLIDAVTGMEGEGPSAGKPRHVGCLVAAKTPYAADMAGISLMNQKPMSIPTMRFAHARGLAPDALEKMEVLGEGVEPFVVEDYDVPTVRHERMLPRLAPKPIMKFAERILRPKPVFIKDKCIGCGECMRSCPPKAITMKNGFPQVDLKACIRCFCCQELCPKQAVRIKRSRIIRGLR